MQSRMSDLAFDESLPSPATGASSLSRFRRSLTRTNALPASNEDRTLETSSELPRRLTLVLQGTSEYDNAPRHPRGFMSRPTKKSTPFERFLKLAKRKKGKPTGTPTTHLPDSLRDDVINDYSHDPLAGEVDEGDATVPSEVGPTSLGNATTRCDEADSKLLTNEDTAVQAECETTCEAAEDIPPEPTFLARTIQGLLSALPLSSSSTCASSTASPSSDTTPSAPPQILDSKLVSFLSSPSIMNGSNPKGSQSVWSMLDLLTSKVAEPCQNAHGGGAHQGDCRENDEDTDTISGDDDSSVMLYAPLIPDARSEVEIARSEVVSLDEESWRIMSSREYLTTSRREHGDGRSSTWSFMGSEKEECVTLMPATERKIWVPSTTKISLEVRWWGYRVYLPPPILDLLNNQRIEASKRAALVTTAFKWLLDHIPETVIPPQVRPVLQLLKGLVPYLAYIGGFVAWTWGAIKGFDKGNGVILTATWLLPVALIPGTWEDHEVPEATPDID
ncbi:hypothetical protein AcW1_001273 [Taiwanofungus camphoratus]|nr:hypothetical protein AcW1_001273 [Antrodia cinnamomea]